jgi:DNA-binding NarL/FixJ family response regulator
MRAGCSRMGAGEVGYLLKDRVGDVRQFVEAVRRVADGGTAMDPEVISQYPRAQVPADATGRADGQGTRGARADGRGRTNAAIARRLVITIKAVSKHIASIFAKLGMPPSGDDHRRVLAVLAYLNSSA